MIGYCPLASGSKGNSIYLGSPETKILIDCGISGKATQERLAELNVSLEDIDAIFITHEHGDHIQGLKTICKKFSIPVFANSATAKGIIKQLKFEDISFHIFTSCEPFMYRDLHVQPFSICHDTLDPVAFTIAFKKTKLGICTDLGHSNHLVYHHLANCDYLYVEANHDPELLMQSQRPSRYKQRVLGRSGHLSNQACAELLEHIQHGNLKHVHLAHLSQDCNDKDLAMRTIHEHFRKQNLKELSLSIAPQNKIGQAIFF